MSETHTITGRVLSIGHLQEISERFQKQQLVVETLDGEYRQTIPIEFHQKRVELLEGLSPKDQVQVDFDIRGNEYKGRYYVNLVGWRISKEGRNTAPPVERPDTRQGPAPEAPAPPSEEQDDIPF